MMPAIHQIPCSNSDCMSRLELSAPQDLPEHLHIFFGMPYGIGHVAIAGNDYQFRLGGIAPGRAARSVIILETKRPIRFVLFQFTIMEVPHLPSA